MAHPYKNTPLNQNSEGSLDKFIRLQEIADMKGRISGELPYTYDGDKIPEKEELPKHLTLEKLPNTVIGGGGALELISGGGVLKVFQGGKKLLGLAKNLWNTGRKGGFGYAKPIATGKPLSQNIKTNYKSWGGKQHRFENFGKPTLTKADKLKAIKTTRPYKIAGITGRLGTQVAVGTGAWKYGVEKNSELQQRELNQIANDNIVAPNKNTKSIQDLMNKTIQSSEKRGDTINTRF